MKTEPLLTIIIVGRNDDYLGNYRYRLQTCLDFLAENLRQLGRLDDVEVLFVDWNSQGAPLSDELEVTDDAAGLLRFVLVPPAVAKARNMQVSFFTTCAVNVGVRRARGRFIMLADSDSLMPLPSLKALLSILDGTLPTHGPSDKLIYPIPRHQIPGAIAARRPNAAAWAEILKRLMASRRKELPSADCLGGFSAAQLMHRDVWFEFGGYNEKLDRAWGWSDNELMFRVTQKYNWMDVGYYGVVAFHIEHFASTGNAHSRDPNSVNKMHLSFNPFPNAPDWGLARETLPERTVKGRGRYDPAPRWAPMRRTIASAADWAAFAADQAASAMTARAAHSNRERGQRAAVTDDVVCALGGVLLRDYPRNCVHVGALRWPVLTMLVEGQPGIDLFLIEPWREGLLDGAPGDPGMLSMLLANSQYRGFARILIGPAAAALDALEASDPLSQPIDLAVIERTDVEDDFQRVAAGVLTRLALGGAVVLVDEKRRLPRSDEEASILCGRLLASGPAPTESAARRGVFSQSAEEARLGKGFTALTMGSGAVCLLRRPPQAESAQAQGVLPVAAK